MIKKIYSAGMAIMVVGILPMGLPAEQSNYAAGRIGGMELRIPQGPRVTAQGEAFTARADDLHALAWNPAGLAQIGTHQAEFAHTVYLADTAADYIGYAQQLASGAGLGAQAVYFTYGRMDRMEAQDLGGTLWPEKTGEFTPSAWAATIGYGQWVAPGLALGGAVKCLSQHIDTKIYAAAAVDISVLLKAGEGVQVGLAVQNLGTMLADAYLPLTGRAGAAWVLPWKADAGDEWSFQADVQMPVRDMDHVSGHVGTEYWIRRVLAIRAGYTVKNQGGLEGVAGLTAGLGVKFAVLQIDYALATFGDLGLIHQAGIGIAF